MKSTSGGSASAGSSLRPWAGLGADVSSGFVVFLVALPLSVAIAVASGFPATAGLIAAAVGGLLGALLSDSALGVKGPAAGLIVIALGCITELSQIDPGRAYPLALGIAVVSGVVQMLLGLFRAGRLVEYMPTTVVHALLAAVGIMVASRQIHVLLGVQPEHTSPLGLLAEIPQSILRTEPRVLAVGITALVALVGHRFLPARIRRAVPAPLLGVGMSVVAAFAFSLDVALPGAPRAFVAAPQSLLAALVFPDFGAVLTPIGAKYIALFALIGTVESLLSARAVDLLDKRRRKTNLDRDLLAVGAANTVAAFLGGLPMITEIARSTSNAVAGAESRRSAFSHGVFLLAVLSIAPGILGWLPLAGLAALLLHVASRLASPRELRAMWRLGWDQFAVFLTTIIVTLATDLLVGIVAGVFTQFAVDALGARAWEGMLRPKVKIDAPLDDGASVVHVGGAAVFCNWPVLRRLLVGAAAATLIVDFSAARVVDHTVLEQLECLHEEFERSGRRLSARGLAGHRALGKQPTSTRWRPSKSTEPTRMEAGA